MAGALQGAGRERLARLRLTQRNLSLHPLKADRASRVSWADAREALVLARRVETEPSLVTPETAWSVGMFTWCA